MNTPNEVPNRPVHFPVLSRFVTWGAVRRLLILLAVTASALALFYAVENWRGQHAWEALKRQCEAQGEHLDLAAFVPKPVPDEQNLAMTPLLKPLYDYQRTGIVGIVWRDPEGARRARSLAPIRSTETASMKPSGLLLWPRAKQVDLQAWQLYFRGSNMSDLALPDAVKPGGYVFPAKKGEPAPAIPTDEFPVPPEPGAPPTDVLLALSKFEPQLDEMRAASRRPYAQFPNKYTEGIAPLAPHLSPLWNLSQTLALRATAELAQSNTAAAQEDIQLGFRLCQALGLEPWRASHLFRFFSQDVLLQPLWEGLAERRWTDAQLAAFQALLRPIDLRSNVYQVFACERALANQMFDLLIAGKWAIDDLQTEGDYDEESYWRNLLLGYGPRGWLYHNKVTYNRLIKPSVDHARQFAQTGVYPLDADRDENRFHAALQQPTRDTQLARLLTKHPFAPFSRDLMSTARGQTSIDLALVACALERHRLARGQFPEALPALVPDTLDKLPIDIMNGQPLIYRRTDDGQFILYSVGANLLDDDGIDPDTAREPGWERPEPGDWVWRYPARK